MPETIETNREIADEATISMSGANLMALFMVPIAFILLWLPYWIAWEVWPFAGFLQTSFGGITTLVLVMVASIIVHELLHALGFWLVGGVPWRRIKFGFSWQGFAPYAHCRDPLQTTAYRISVALPGLVLGVLPGLVGVAIQQPLLGYVGNVDVAGGGRRCGRFMGRASRSQPC